MSRIGVRAMIVEYCSDGGYPDWLRIELTDAHGCVWTIVEKVPVVTAEDLTSESGYPRPILLDAWEINRRQIAGRETVVARLDYHVESSDESRQSEFEMRPESIVRSTMEANRE